MKKLYLKITTGGFPNGIPYDDINYVTNLDKCGMLILTQVETVISRNTRIPWGFFAVTSHHFVEPLLLSVLDLGLTLPMGFKTSGVCTITRAKLSLACNGSSESTLIAQARALVPCLHLVMVRLLLEWLLNTTSRTAGRSRFGFYCPTF